MAELGLALGSGGAGADGGNSLLGSEASYGSSFALGLAEPPKPHAAPQHPYRR